MAFDLEYVRRALPGRSVEWHGSTPSTMLVAAQRLEEGAPGGTVVGADEQTAGQGRLGRAWHSEPDAGLYFSFLLRLGLALSDLPVVTLALGVATVEAVSAVTGVICDLRWPNDVLIGDRKVCGILVQAQGDGLVCGIGVNVNHREFPEEIRSLATSLFVASGRTYAREPLLVALLQAIDHHTELLVKHGRDPILQAFSRASSYVQGRRVIVDNGATRLTGTTDGLNNAGYLMLRQDNGNRTAILAGGVRPA